MILTTTTLLLQTIIFIGNAAQFSRDEAYAVVHKSMDKELLEREFVNSELARVSRKWAAYLHGQVQAKYLIAATPLEGSVGTADPHSVQASLDLALRTISSLPEINSPARTSFREELEYRIGLWSGLVNVSLDIQTDRENPKFTSVEGIGVLVDEGTSNSVRHGRAKNIWVSLASLENGWFELVMTDDGNGPTGGRAGLGTKFLQQVAGNNWTLRREAEVEQTVLTVRFH